MDAHIGINTTNYMTEENTHKLARFGNAISIGIEVQGGGEIEVVPQVSIDWNYTKWFDFGGVLTVKGSAYLSPDSLTGITGFRLKPITENVLVDLYTEEYHDSRYTSF